MAVDLKAVDQVQTPANLAVQPQEIVPQGLLVTTQIKVDPETKKIPLDLNVSSYDWVIAGSIIASAFISFLAFKITAKIVEKSTEAQIYANRTLIENQTRCLEKEIDARNKQLISEKLIEYSSKLISGQANLIIRLRDFGVFYGSMDEKEKLDRTMNVGQIYQELRDISNQVLQDYHVLELFLLSKGRAINNLVIKSKLFFNLLWPYLEILLADANSQLYSERQSETISRLFGYSEYEKLGNELTNKIGEENLSIYILLNELNRNISEAIKNEIKKAA